MGGRSNGRTVRQSQGSRRDPFVVSGCGSIRKKPLDDRGDQGEAELSHFGCVFHCFSIFAHGKDRKR